MMFRAKLNHLNLKDMRNYPFYLAGILVEVIAVLLLAGVGFLIAWLVPRFGR